MSLVYLTLKFLHIFLAIIAVGFTSSFGLILGRAGKTSADGRDLTFALGTIRVMGLIAHACYFLLFVTGFGLIHSVGYPWYAWLKWSVGIYVIAFLTAQFVLIPSVSKRLAIVETRGPADPEFIALSKRAAAIGALLGIGTLVILWLMVAKPA
jgi:uncharacterized membrane protein